MTRVRVVVVARRRGVAVARRGVVVRGWRCPLVTRLPRAVAEG